MRTISGVTNQPQPTPAEVTPKRQLHPLYRKKVKAYFKGWVFTIPSGLFLVMMVNPLVTFTESIKILIALYFFSTGVGAFVMGRYFGAELKKQQRHSVLAEEIEAGWD